MDPPPVFTLLSDTLPRRSQSAIRRKLTSLGATVHVATANADGLPTGTTHLLLSEQKTSTLLVLAIAAARHIRFVTPAFAEDADIHATLRPPHRDAHHPPACAVDGDGATPSSTEFVPPPNNALWIGQLWLGAYVFWRRRAAQGFHPPLYSHRVLVVGQLRPRGAARLFAPSTAVVKNMLLSAGAELAREQDGPNARLPTFAVVAPGLTPQNSRVVAHLLTSDVLCLGPAFVIDLIVRVSADPIEALLFPSQRSLCAPRLDSESIPTLHPPLSISKAQSAPDGQKTSVAVTTQLEPVPTSDGVSPIALLSPSASASTPAPPLASTFELASNVDATPVSEPASSSMSKPALQPGSQHTPKSVSELVLKSASASASLSHAEEVPISTPASHLFAKTSHNPTSKSISKHTPKRASRKSSSKSPRTPLSKPSTRSGSNPKSSPTSASASGRIAKPLSTPKSSPSSLPSPKVVRTSNCRLASDNPTRRLSAPSTLQFFPCKLKISAPTLTHFPVDLRPIPSDDAVVVVSSSSIATDSKDKEDSPTQGVNSAVRPDRVRRRHGFIRSLSDSEGSDASRPLVSNPRLQHHDVSISGKNRSKHAPPASRTKSHRRDSDSEDDLESQALISKRSMYGLEEDASMGEEKSVPVRANQRSCAWIQDSYRDGAISQAPMSKRKRSRLDEESTANDGKSYATPSISRPSLQKDRFVTYSGDNDYAFIMTTIGGEPSEQAMKRMLKSIGAPEDYWKGIEVEPEQQRDVDLPHAEFEDSPAMDGDHDIAPVPSTTMNGSFRPSQRNVLTNDNLFRKDDGSDARGWASQPARRRGKDTASRSMGTDIEIVIVPKKPILLKNIVRPELGLVESAHLLNLASGNIDDDLACQSSIIFSDWLLAAEHLVGFVTQGTEGMAQSGWDSVSRKVWLSLFESNVFERLAAPGGLSESQVAAVVGICTRLITCNMQPEMGGRLVRELLKLREKQKATGMDSLHTVLAATSMDEVHFRHRAIAAIWAVLFQSAAKNADGRSIVRLIDGGLKSHMDDLFETAKSLDKVFVRTVDEKVREFIDTLWLLTLMHAVRVDLSDGEDGVGAIEEDVELFPENWDILCHMFERLGKWASSPAGCGEVTKGMVLRTCEGVVQKFCGKVWRVNEAIVSACAKAVQALGRVHGLSCFCERVPVHASRFRELSVESHADELKTVLKNGCDYSLYLGWHWVTHGTGNGMKRVINVIRHASILTSGECTSVEGRVRKVRHHVGLVLSLADCVAEHSNGEEQVCGILTSKCVDFVGMLSDNDASRAENEQKWEYVLEGMVMRCRCLVQRGEGVEMYAKWLFNAVLEGLSLMERVAKRRVGGVKERELMRVQEGLLWTGTMKRLEGLQEVLIMTRRKWEEGVLRWETMRKCVDIGFEYGPQLFRRMRVKVEQMRLSQDDSGGGKRALMLVEVVGVCKWVMELMVVGCRRSLNAEGGGLIGKLMEGCGVVSQVATREHCDALVEVMSKGSDLLDDKAKRLRCVRMCAEMVCCFIEVRCMAGGAERGVDVYGEVVALIRRCGVEVLSWKRQAGPGHNAARGNERAEDGAVVRFWWRATRKCKWVREAVCLDRSVKGIVAGMAGWAIMRSACLSDEDDEERRMIEEMRRELREMEGMQDLVESWVGHVEEENSAVAGNAECVNKAMQYVAREMGRLNARSLAGELREKGIRLVRGRRRGGVLEGMRVIGLAFRTESQGRGFCAGAGARWMVDWLGAICEAVQAVRHTGGWRGGEGWSGACEALLKEVLGGLSMTRCEGADVEMRVMVLRVVTAVGDGDDLNGVWRADGKRMRFGGAAGGSMSERVVEEMQTRAERQLDEWRRYILRARVEDAVVCGTAAGGAMGGMADAAEIRTRFALRRLLAAAKAGVDEIVGEAGGPMRRAVTEVVRRMGNNAGLQGVVQRDVAAQIAWRQVAEQVATW